MAEHIFTLEAEGDERIWRQMNVHLHLYSAYMSFREVCPNRIVYRIHLH